MVKSVGSRRMGIGAPLGRSVFEAAALQRAQGQAAAASNVGSSATGAASSGILSAAAAPPAARDDPVMIQGGVRYRIPQAKCKTTPAPPSAPSGARGSLAAAASTAASEENMESAITALLRDQFAATSVGSRNSMLRTWLAMHRMAYCRLDSPPSGISSHRGQDSPDCSAL